MQSFLAIPTKPKFIDALIIPCVCELRYLFSHPLTVWNSWKKIREQYRVILVFFTVDMEARHKLLKLTSWNSYDGCGVCNVVGYCIHNRMGFGGTGTIRTKEEFNFDAKHRLQGVCEYTVFNLLSYFDFTRQIPLEGLHLLWLGVARELTELTINTIGETSIDTIYKSAYCKLPSDTRKFRSLVEISRMKGSEVKMHVLNCVLPMIGPFLTNDLKELWFYMLNYIEAAMSRKVQEAIQFAESFISRYKNLRGEEFVTAKIHSMMHFPSYIEPFENESIFSSWWVENFLSLVRDLTMDRSVVNSETIWKGHFYSLSRILESHCHHICGMRPLDLLTKRFYSENISVCDFIDVHANCVWKLGEDKHTEVPRSPVKSLLIERLQVHNTVVEERSTISDWRSQ